MAWAYRLSGAARRAGPLALALAASGAGAGAASWAAACSGASSASSAPAPAAGGAGGKNPRVWVHDALEGEGMLARKALGVDPELLKSRLERLVLFSGSSNPTLAEEVAYELHKPLGNMAVNRFSDGETQVQAMESVRGKDVYIIQSTSQPVNENLVELCLMVSALRRASARTITAIMPYYGYKRDVGTVSTLTHLIRHGIGREGAARAVGGAVSGSAAVTAAGGAAASGSSSSSSPSPSPANAASSAAAGEGDGGAVAFPVSAADVARMLETVGVDRILSIELQPPGMGQIEVREGDGRDAFADGASPFSLPPSQI
jgi:hypothetical protein